MVVETHVKDLLKRYLSDYIENLNTAQLQTSVGWSRGDVVLNDLHVRSTALDELDLPITLKYGNIGKLTLKIPWGYVLQEPVSATIQGLYVLAMPKVGAKYDAAKEEKRVQEEKQQELLRLEQQRQVERKTAQAGDSHQKKADTFAEKLSAQIIQNLQIVVEDVHIRYEDAYTNSARPFAAGVSLSNMIFQTSDAKGRPLSEMFHKKIELTGLALYFQCGTDLISSLDERARMKRLMENMFKKSSLQKGYILAPTTLGAYLTVNRKPEKDDFKEPKLTLRLEMGELSFSIGKEQYQDMLQLLDARERLQLQARFRKYHPHVNTYKGHEKAWWKFAVDCVAKEQKEQQLENWSWDRIEARLKLTRKYTAAWIEKQTTKPVSMEALAVIERAEKTLSVFVLNLAREEAESKIDRRKLKRVEEGGFFGYFAGWWGGGGQAPTTATRAVTVTDEAWTPEDRAELFRALKYKEGQKTAKYPEHFVDKHAKLSLKKLSISVYEDMGDKSEEVTEVMLVTLKGARLKMQQREAADAIKFSAHVEKFRMEGIQGPDQKRPLIVSAIAGQSRDETEDEFLLRVETNPTDHSFHMSVQLHTRQLKIVHNAASVQKMTEVFSPPESCRSKQILEAAATVTEHAGQAVGQSAWSVAAAFGRAREKPSKLKLDIQMHAPIIVLPQSSTSSEALLADLGTLIIVNKPNAPSDKYLYKLELREMKLSRVILGDNRWSQTAEVRLMDPVSFMFDITRNLLWEKKKRPEITVQGRLPLLQVCLSQEDYTVLMNMTSSFSEEPTQAKAITIETELLTGTSISVSSSQHSQSGPDMVKFQFDFEAETARLMLYNGSSGLSVGLQLRDPAKSLAVIEMKSMVVVAKLKGDDSLWADFTVHSFAINDGRPDRIGITRMLDKKGRFARGSKMMKAVYMKDAKGTKRVDVEIWPFHLYFCPEFISHLSQFTTGEVPPSGTSPSGEAAKVAPTDEKDEEAGMEVRIAIKQSELVVVEKPEAPESTQAIILEFNAAFAIQTGKNFGLSGDVTKLEMTSTYFADEKRSVNPLKVISPCEFHIVWQTGQTTMFQCPKMEIRISPNVIRLLSVLAASIASTQARETATPEAPTMIKCRGVWKKMKNSDCNFWFINEVLDTAYNAGRLLPPIEDVKQAGENEQLRVDMDDMRVILEVEGLKETMPMIDTRAAFHAIGYKTERGTRYEAIMKLEIWYFNRRLKAWEPLLDPHVEPKRAPWELEFIVNENSAYDAVDGNVCLLPPKLSVEVIGRKRLQLTASKMLLEMLGELGEAFSRATTPVEADPTEKVSISVQQESISDTSGKGDGKLITFVNALPRVLEISAQSVSPKMLKGGESAAFSTITSGMVVKLQVKEVVDWTCDLLIDDKFNELSQHTFYGKHPVTGAYVEMDLGIRSAKRRGTQELTVYCPFWMVNKMGLKLNYKVSGRIRPMKRSKSWSFTEKGKKSMQASSKRRASSSSSSKKKNSLITDFEHDSGESKPVMFTFSGSAFFAKNKKACLRVHDSQWSKDLPLDIVGNAGRAICKAKGGKRFEVGIDVQLANSGLTKICTFTPFYLIDNRTVLDIEVRQRGIGSAGGRWARIPQKQVGGFWPEVKMLRMQVSCRYVEVGNPGMAESQPFPITESFQSLVIMPNEFVGVFVTTHISDNAVVISVEHYQDGMTPALLVNHTEKFVVSYQQKPKRRRRRRAVGSVNQLSAGYCALFAWADVMSDRTLLWQCSKEKRENDLLKDGLGEVRMKNGIKLYWVSFLSGRQRVLLFTQDLAVAMSALEPYELARPDRQYTISLHSINLSLVLAGREFASMGILSSRTLWQYKSGDGRFKAYGSKDCVRLEEEYIKYKNEERRGRKVKSPAKVSCDIEIDFAQMKQQKPKVREIRRFTHNGFWMQYTLGLHEQKAHIKVDHFQIDNQSSSAIFPVVLAPNLIATRRAPKPFVEVSFIVRSTDHSSFPRIKYFKVLVQEMVVRVDKGFLNDVIDVFRKEAAAFYTPELFKSDMVLTERSLTELAEFATSTGQMAYYEQLHLSPMKIRLSFSLGGSGDDKQGQKTPFHGEVINLLLQSVGVTLTNVRDVDFKLAYFERNAVYMNRQQLLMEATRHYTNQTIKQLYVLVFGLDIFGNPFGLIRDFSAGVEALFYEPIQGAVEGPEELAEGLAIGMKSMLAGTVGGAAGVVSRITGSLGNGLAALTLDREYQIKRQQMLSQRSANVGEGLARGAKGLVMGFAEGISGVVMKPIEGAKKGGVKGFATGVGIGAAGLVMRPASGLLDFTESAFDAVKRLTSGGKEVRQMRPARFVRRDNIIRPFSLWEARGNKLLLDVGKGKFAQTDVYTAHAPATRSWDTFTIVTDKRIILVQEESGSFKICWECLWKHLAYAPKLTKEGLIITLKHPKREVKRIVFHDEKMGEIIESKSRKLFQTVQ